MKLDLIVSMHRTGHHAVAVWLLHQRQGVEDFSITTVSPWLFAIGLEAFVDESHPLNQVEGQVYQQFRRQSNSKLYFMANNPLKIEERADKERLKSIVKDDNPDGLIVTHEQEGINDTIDKATKSPFSFNKPIVVIRDFRNWVASCIKMALRDNKTIEDVINDDKVSMYADHVANYGKSDYHFIKFNDWATNKDYRKTVCKNIGYTFTDAAKDQLSIFGGGSSFSGMQYFKNASDMDVNNRYKEIETHPYYKTLLNKHKEVLKLSDTIFK
tara:strand:- start:191 stop:1000 length:810 start_codon:yes stop_codon:yes gene_type:complete